jgi:hypothetical protein
MFLILPTSKTSLTRAFLGETMVATVDYFSKFLEVSGDLDLLKVKAHPGFLRLVQPFLSTPKVIPNSDGKYDFLQLLEAVKSLPDVIRLDTGDTMSKKVLVSIYKMLAAHSRSEYLEGTQSKNPGISAAVPLVLASYRTNKGIKYEDWNWSGEYNTAFMTGVLGKSLAPLLEQIHNVPGEYTHEKLAELREASRVSSKNTLLNTKLVYIAKSGDPWFDSMHKNFRFMLLQWWIWHPATRHEDMIMDLNNLDAMPEPLEVSHIKEIAVDLPWN